MNTAAPYLRPACLYSVLLSLLTLSGCANTISDERIDRYLEDPVTRLDQRFGSSVSHMINTQKYQPQNRRIPAAGQQLEGWEAEAILHTYSHPDT